MTDEDRVRLGERRRLIFENVANGVPVENVMAAFQCSREEVLRETSFVSRKIREYRHQRRLPPVLSSTVSEIMTNRHVLLATLGKIGPMTLSTELILPNLKVHKIETEAHLREAGRLTRVRVNRMP